MLLSKTTRRGDRASEVSDRMISDCQVRRIGVIARGVKTSCRLLPFVLRRLWGPVTRRSKVDQIL